MYAYWVGSLHEIHKPVKPQKDGPQKDGWKYAYCSYQRTINYPGLSTTGSKIFMKNFVAIFSASIISMEWCWPWILMMTISEGTKKNHNKLISLSSLPLPAKMTAITMLIKHSKKMPIKFPHEINQYSQMTKTCIENILQSENIKYYG